MNILLDTHAALWWWADSESLGPEARLAMADPTNDIHFSAASAYEILQKVRLGRLTIPKRLETDLSSAVREEGWQQLPLTIPAAVRAAALDHPQRDPFDRMLAAQAQLGDFTLATKDAFFNQLEINLIW